MNHVRSSVVTLTFIVLPQVTEPLRYKTETKHMKHVDIISDKRHEILLDNVTHKTKARARVM